MHGLLDAGQARESLQFAERGVELGHVLARGLLADHVVHQDAALAARELAPRLVLRGFEEPPHRTCVAEALRMHNCIQKFRSMQKKQA